MREVTKRDLITVFGICAVILWYCIYKVIGIYIEIYLEFGLPVTVIAFAISILISAYAGKWVYEFLWRVVDKIKTEGR